MEGCNSSRSFSISGDALKLWENKQRSLSSSGGHVHALSRLKFSLRTEGEMSARAPGVRARVEMWQKATDKSFGRIGAPPG